MENEEVEQIKSVEEAPISSNNDVRTDQRTAELEERLLRLEQELAQAKKNAAKKTTRPRTTRSNSSQNNSRTRTTQRAASHSPNSVAYSPSQTSTNTSVNNANKTRTKKTSQKESGAAVARFWIAFAVFIFQLIFTIYIITHY